MNGIASSWTEVTTGIPQGSVLRTILFLIYMNDLPGVVHCSMKFFADDAKMFSTGNTLEQASNFQSDILKAVKWSEDRLLKYKNKCRNQLLQLYTARSAWSDSVIMSASIRFGNYPLAQQSCGGDIGSVPYVCM